MSHRGHGDHGGSANPYFGAPIRRIRNRTLGTFCGNASAKSVRGRGSAPSDSDVSAIESLPFHDVSLLPDQFFERNNSHRSPQDDAFHLSKKQRNFRRWIMARLGLKARQAIGQQLQETSVISVASVREFPIFRTPDAH
jgi:hypothetical protein